MRILIAEDDPISRRVLEATLQRWGYDVLVARDGAEAWEQIQEPDAPHLMILDWMMPGVDGLTLCQQVRASEPSQPRYILMLSAKSEKSDLIAGLEAGADDYVTKPFEREELRARLRVGRRVVGLQATLLQQVHALQETMAQVKVLSGILPICSYCSRVRDDDNYWARVEAYISKHTDARFSHGICPECWKQEVEPELAQLPPCGH